MKESIMSFYNAPITNQVPNGVVSIDQLYTYVSTNEWLRERTDRTRVALDDEKRFRQLKQNLLPYVTPAGVFSYRKEDRLLFPSGELVIDIDHLASPEEACTWRDTLFADERLRPDLSFVSPSTTGIKLLVPYRLSIKKTVEESFDEAVRCAWEYLEWKYNEGKMDVPMRIESRYLKRRPVKGLFPLFGFLCETEKVKPLTF